MQSRSNGLGRQKNIKNFQFHFMHFYSGKYWMRKNANCLTCSPIPTILVLSRCEWPWKAKEYKKLSILFYIMHFYSGKYWLGKECPLSHLLPPHLPFSSCHGLRTCGNRYTLGDSGDFQTSRYQGIVKATVSYRLQDLKFEISEGSDQN